MKFQILFWVKIWKIFQYVVCVKRDIAFLSEKPHKRRRVSPEIAWNNTGLSALLAVLVLIRPCVLIGLIRDLNWSSDAFCYSFAAILVWQQVFNLYQSLGKFSRRQIDNNIFFLIYPRRQDLTFHRTVSTEDNLLAILNPVFRGKWENV